MKGLVPYGLHGRAKALRYRDHDGAGSREHAGSKE